MHSDVPICLDSQGAQIRTGRFQGGQATIQDDEVVELVSHLVIGSNIQVPIYPDEALGSLTVGDVMNVDFGTLQLQVVEASEKCFARVLSGGAVGSNKGIAVDRQITLPPLTDIDRECLVIGIQQGVRHVALSFAHRPTDVRVMRTLVGDDVEIISKIESSEAVQNFEGIAELSDAVLIDRGDLSREIPLEKLPFVQRDLLERAKEAEIPAYVATNLLETMISSPRPTRAELNDVASTLRDGASGLVLAAETAVGRFPVGCVAMIRALIQQFEQSCEGSLNMSAFSETAATSLLPPPLGGELVNQITHSSHSGKLDDLPTLEIDERILMDARQIATGAFSPLKGFMTREQLASVLDEYRTPEGVPWTMPILLPGSLLGLDLGERLSLTFNGVPRALITIEDLFEWDVHDLARRWFGTDDPRHPGVERILEGSSSFIGGEIQYFSDLGPGSPSFELSPHQARLAFEHRSWQRVVGFHTRNVPHRAHEFIQFEALERSESDGIFIHPVMGPKKKGDLEGRIILKAYQRLIREHYPTRVAVLSGFETYSRYAGPREAVFTAIVRQNFGCSHFIIGRDHTGVHDFYKPHASQRLFELIGDIAIQPVFFGEIAYCQLCQTYIEDGCKHEGAGIERISGTHARNSFRKSDPLPHWYMRDVVQGIISEELEQGRQVFVG